jgi:hypothetical protein
LLYQLSYLGAAGRVAQSSEKEWLPQRSD